MIRVLLATLILLSLGGCVGLPENIMPVQGFELQRYLGKWYEVARLDHSFERGLEQVTADYSLRQDGGVRVINKGYSIKNGELQEAEGRAYFVHGEDQGYLKVSFFGPFYGSYVIFKLDKEDYQYAFVAGPDKSYLWLLSRKPTISAALMNDFITTATTLGFDTDNLILVRQTEGKQP